MTLLTVCQDVCEFVGVMKPQSIFSGIAASRTQQELLALANEMAQRIAFDQRDWTTLYRRTTIVGDGYSKFYPFPPNFKRLLLDSNIYRSSYPQRPLTFLPNIDDVLQRSLTGYWYTTTPGYYWISQNTIGVFPLLAGPTPAHPLWLNSTAYAVSAKVRDPDNGTAWQAAVAHTSAPTGTTFAADRAAHPTYWITTAQLPATAPAEFLSFVYLGNDCIEYTNIGAGSVFLNDDDTFFPDERLLKLGMIWQWKAKKGTPYAEDMGTFEDAMARFAGADKPAPIIIGRQTISARATVAMPWPADWGSVTR